MYTDADFRLVGANAAVILDTSGDNLVTAVDALRVINVLNQQWAAEGEQVPAGRASTDVNGDGSTTAVDALMILNYLQREHLAEAEPLQIEELLPFDHDDDEDDDAILAIDLALTQGLV